PQNELPMVQTDFVRKKTAGRKISLSKRCRDHHDERHQNNDQKTDQKRVGRRLSGKHYLRGGHLACIPKLKPQITPISQIRKESHTVFITNSFVFYHCQKLHLKFHNSPA